VVFYLLNNVIIPVNTLDTPNFRMFMVIISGLSISWGGLFAQQSVIYGSNAEEGRYPWMATLTTTGLASNHCGATLIADRWVITAAHCTYNIDTSAMEVILNPYLQENPQPYADTIKVDKVIVHPRGFGTANDSLYADIALLRLNRPSSIRPIQLAVLGDASWYEVDSFPTQVLGWGFVDTLFGSTDTLQLGRPVMISKARCQDLYSTVSTPLKDWEICAGHLDSSQPEGAAFGDSGGPLLVERNGSLLQVGIVARGRGAFTTIRRPGIFTQVEEFVAWIDSVTNGALVPIIDAQPTRLQVDIQVLPLEIALTWNREARHQRQVMIIDLTGRVLLRQAIEPLASVTQLDISNLSKGFYILKILEDGSQLSRNWVQR